jgi:hypothetical protein
MTTVSDLNENTELVTLTSSQEQVLLNDIDNSANHSHLLNDGLDDIFRTYDLLSAKKKITSEGKCLIKEPQ